MLSMTGYGSLVEPFHECLPVFWCMQTHRERINYSITQKIEFNIKLEHTAVLVDHAVHGGRSRDQNVFS